MQIEAQGTLRLIKVYNVQAPDQKKKKDSMYLFWKYNLINNAEIWE